MKQILLALCAAVLCSCLSYDEEIWVKPDLSGTIQMNLKINQMIVGMAAAQSGGAFSFSEDSIRNNIKKVQGLSLVSLKSVSDQTNLILSIRIKFDSFESLQKLGKGNDKMGFWGEINIKTTGNRITFSRTISLNSSEQGASKEDTADQMQNAMAGAIFSQYAWKYVIHFPAKVLNANTIDDNIDLKTNTVTWNYSLTSVAQGGPQTMIATLEKPGFVFPPWSVLIAFGCILSGLLWLVIGKYFRKGKESGKPVWEMDKKQSSGSVAPPPFTTPKPSAIWVYRNNQKWGPYSVEQIKTMGLLPDEPVWYEGCADWVPYGSLHF